MGQAQSEVASSSPTPPPPPPSAQPHQIQGQEQQASSSSMESLLAEAAAYSNDENESFEAKAQKALECPCIADLRNGPCGVRFSDAFLCFLKSTAEEKGSDCVHPFVALQNCIKANPGAFSKEILEEDEEVKKEEEPAQEYKITPPIWSRESPSPKSKL